MSDKTPLPECVRLALEAVNGPRRDDYGHPATNHARTAALWSAYLGTEINAEQVCMLNLLQKVSRLVNSPDHQDSLVDIVGWAINKEMVDGS